MKKYRVCIVAAIPVLAISSLLFHVSAHQIDRFPKVVNTASFSQPEEAVSSAPVRLHIPTNVEKRVSKHMKAGPKPTVIPRGNALAAQKRQTHKPITEPHFASFAEWSDKFMQADGASRAALEAEGLTLARKRRAAMSEMIQKNPERALQLTVPFAVRSILPANVTTLLEERIGGRGKIEVAIATAPERVEVKRTAYLGDRYYEAFTYGRRASLRSEGNVVMQGIVVDNLFAVDELSVRVLDPQEAAVISASIDEVVTSDEVCAVSNRPVGVNEEKTIVEAGGETIVLCSVEHVDELNEQLLEGEARLYLKAQPLGTNRLLIISAKFSGGSVPKSQADLETSFFARPNSFYQANSYGTCSLAPLGPGGSKFLAVTLPNAKSFYNSQGYAPGSDDLKADALAAANAILNPLGEDTADYDLKSIVFDECGNWFYWAYALGGCTLFNGKFSANTVIHEHGHSFGLSHAGAWMSNTGDPIAADRLKKTYGDIFDIMGNSSTKFAGTNWSSGIEHYNVFHKRDLGWIRSVDWTDVPANSSATYTIYANDTKVAREPGGTRKLALRILRPGSGNSTNYWIGYRQLWATNSWLLNGVQVHLQASPMIKDTDYGNADTALIDMTPNSKSRYTGSSVIPQDQDMEDSALVIGKTFSDTGENIHITPIRKGTDIISSTSVNWIEIVVNRGVSGNSAPTNNFIAGQTNGAVADLMRFTAEAVDPNGDALAYYWDFHDGAQYNPDFQSLNTNSITKSWSSPGTYKVRCTVTDMRGGVVTKALTVKIQETKIAQWNFNSTTPDGNTGTGVTTPSTGSGSITATSVSANGFNDGSPSDPAVSDNSGRGWQGPSTNVANRTAGNQFTVSTEGYTDIVVSWEMWTAPRSSAYWRGQYTINGTTWIDRAVVDKRTPFLANGAATYTPHSDDLTGIAGVANNPDFAYRIVAEYQSTATGSGSATYVPTDANDPSGYNNTGPFRLDMVTVIGKNMGALAPMETQAIPLGIQHDSRADTPTVVLNWQTVPWIHYEVQYTTDLNTGPWITLTNLVSNGATVSLTDPLLTGESQRFYRLIAR